MKKKLFVGLVVGIMVTALFYFNLHNLYALNDSKGIGNEASLDGQYPNKNKIDPTTDKQQKGQDKKSVKEPAVSTQINRVPWENNEKFKEMQKKYGAYELMAGYCTVLKDPLPGEEDNVHLAASLLAGTVIQPGEIFSQNSKIGPYNSSRGFKKGPTYFGTQLATTIGGGVCKISSTLYNVAVLSNLQVIERYPHSMPVPYVPYGQDATVSYGTRDFKFKNNQQFPILVWAQGVGNRLYMGIYGEMKPLKIEWHHELLKVFKAGKVYRYNPSLEKGKERLVLEGMDGAVTKSWVTIQNPDGTVTTKELGKSYYNPMPYVYEKGN